MLQHQIIRYLHTSFPSWSSISKSHLAKLRKKTGYTFSNCKKALEVNDNDLIKAEKWLQDQAQALGWSKLSKLEGRVTTQGLVGIAFERTKAAIVEVNCETDFVARNKHFKEMVNLASSTFLLHGKKIESSETISKDCFEGEEIKNVQSQDGKTLVEHVALLVSSVGENVTLKRAMCISVKNNLNLACYVHPDSPASGNVINGKYASVVVYSAPEYDSKIQQIARQLCQHVVGMNPKKINKDLDENACENKQVNKSDGEDKEADEEEAMMLQDFLMEPSLTVEQVVTDAGITIHDFVRFETGEKINVEDMPEPKIKATQMGG
ncbi:elongation factor Ts, mitochondrial [Lycorma delicatula]|uniref:elongation factor Ts, mitochondrial n=1 Tax=Lycorma delicatula TaxID=130591 RepID=UPI003F5177C5